MPKERVVAEYIGTAGEFRPGVPATDLNEDQFDALPEEDRVWVLANAESPQPIYKLHGRDIKAEAKEVVASDDVQTVTAAGPMTGGTFGVAGGPQVPVNKAASLAKADKAD